MKYKNVRRKASAALFVGALAFSNMATPLFAKENMNTKTSTLLAKGSFGDRSFNYANTVLKETPQTVNKAQLANKIVEVEKIDKTKYTSESYQTLADAIEKAKGVENNQSATPDEIANVMRELDQVVSALVLLNANKPALDKNNLADGTYEVGVNLWHADNDRPSMADTSFFKTAKIVVKKGVYTIYIRTKPMTLGTITASLQELKVKENGTFKLAKVETTENGSPTSFSFVLPTRDMYLDVLVNPNVAIMGHSDVAARIKVSYDTLKKLSEDVDAPSQNDTTTGLPVVDKETGIKVEAMGGTTLEGVSLKATSLTEHALVTKALQSITNKFMAFDITLMKNGAAMQPNGKVRVSIPMPKGYNKDTLEVYYVNEKGEATLLPHVMNGEMVTFETTHFSIYAIAEGKGARKDAPVIKQTGAQTSNNVGFISLIALSLAGVLAYMTRRKFLSK